MRCVVVRLLCVHVLVVWIGSGFRLGLCVCVVQHLSVANVHTHTHTHSVHGLGCNRLCARVRECCGGVGVNTGIILVRGQILASYIHILVGVGGVGANTGIILT